MGKQIRIGIVGYGNLGRGVEAAIKQNSDMELVAVFSRRSPESVNVIDKNVKVIHISEAERYQADIDVMILCGGSARDLPEQGPAFARLFNTVDSFDTHAKIPAYYELVNEVANMSGKTSIISVGWDPGLFSINRMMSASILPKGETYTFWGKGLSQGHSDAIRRVEGVKGGVQYTIPSETAIDRVRSGENPSLSTSEKHKRECYVVAEEGADKAKIERDIKTMPNYFADYETTVHFITESELKENHSKMPHGGFVIHSGTTGEGNNQIIEFSLKLNSNPEFTASVLTAYARAAYRLNKEGQTGAKTVFDIAPGYLSPKSAADLRRDLL
ncbi:diaminopimelate dehydrogenase [Bacillus aquiflavi]|uniref:Meso-diaminopimelate D-dehydrogenase n=1 Tax=Bacillus aquiflavi TaxID=2672567 RepID=A0A6B3VWM3_9BACI|nr:diaminopimelate dehydrogenase [Bacillus aquiflavi]MBA4536347.1 diaminopimelate dehydrogenase [Bacillus aquiflavi]NEY80715.1 diaminopimelate dehydrogenase [Bacillus aquiflavi]UAC48043.1 diaminopimelate dehydrogenase [Bacillus aquiflavi]